MVDFVQGGIAVLVHQRQAAYFAKALQRPREMWPERLHIGVKAVSEATDRSVLRCRAGLVLDSRARVLFNWWTPVPSRLASGVWSPPILRTLKPTKRARYRTPTLARFPKIRRCAEMWITISAVPLKPRGASFNLLTANANNA